ncbi:MAG: hypothetical protein AAGI54_00595 [Planctomycetota bacterium]
MTPERFFNNSIDAAGLSSRRLRSMLDDHGKDVAHLFKCIDRTNDRIEQTDQPDNLNQRVAVEMTAGSWICVMESILFATAMLNAQAAEQGRPL